MNRRLSGIHSNHKGFPGQLSARESESRKAWYHSSGSSVHQMIHLRSGDTLMLFVSLATPKRAFVAAGLVLAPETTSNAWRYGVFTVAPVTTMTSRSDSQSYAVPPEV